MKSAEAKAKKSKSASKKEKKKQLGDMSLEDFLDHWDDDDSDDEEDSEKPAAEKSPPVAAGKKEKLKKKIVEKKEKAKGKKAKEVKKKEEKEDSDEEDGEEGMEEGGTGAKSQKVYIKSLKDKDPEFYKFLKEFNLFLWYLFEYISLKNSHAFFHESFDHNIAIYFTLFTFQWWLKDCQFQWN